MLVQLTDLHVRIDDDVAATALADAVAHVARLDPRPDAVLISGDLTDIPSAQAYDRVKSLLTPLEGLPLHVIPGNHDDREQLRAAFGLGGGAGEPIVLGARCGPLRLVACDTVVPGSPAGSLDATRLEAVDAELARDTATPTVLAMHHGPGLTGVKAMDAIGLPAADRAALGELVARHPQVKVLASGHSHRTTVTALGGCPVLICPSTYLQVELDLRENATDDPAELSLVAEPPGFALHSLVEGVLTSNIQPVGDVTTS